MNKQDFDEYKKELLNKVDVLYKQADLFAIIKLLEESELDFDLCKELVRAYINAANKTSDPYSLFDKANILLDKFSVEGKDDPKALFYRGYILFKQGLIEESKIRFERALRFVTLEDPNLFQNLNAMIANANDLISLSSFKGLDTQYSQEELEHISKNFGKPEHLCSFNSVDLYRIAPTDKHDYNLLVTVGLAAKKTFNEDLKTVESCEICFALDKDYKFNPDSKSNFEIYMLIEVVKHLIAETNPIGFGYYVEKDTSFSSKTAFNGAMLIGMGEYSTQEQNLVLSDDTNVSFVELLPLRPMELNYRKSHSASDLLNLFKEKLIKITPFVPTRDDVCLKLANTKN